MSVTWGAGGTTKERSLDLAQITQSEYGVDTILHLTCTNMELGSVDDALRVCNMTLIPTHVLMLRRKPKHWAFRTSWRSEEVRRIRTRGVTHVFDESSYAQILREERNIGSQLTLASHMRSISSHISSRTQSSRQASVSALLRIQMVTPIGRLTRRRSSTTSRPRSTLAQISSSRSYFTMWMRLWFGSERYGRKVSRG